MAEVDVVCPSGLAGTIRSLKVRDESLFTDARLQRSGRIIQELCKRCWVRTSDVGPYRFDPGEGQWDRVLQADGFYLFLQIRIASYGPIYGFSIPCRNCRSSMAVEVDLTQDMKAKPLPESSRAFLGDEPATIQFQEHEVQFKLLALEDYKAVSTLRETRKMLPTTATLVHRIVGLDGQRVLRGAAANFVLDLDAGEAEDLLNAMEEVDCGIDVQLETTCPSCLFDQDFLLPFEGRNFFSRKRVGQSSTDEPGSSPA